MFVCVVISRMTVKGSCIDKQKDLQETNSIRLPVCVCVTRPRVYHEPPPRGLVCVAPPGRCLSPPRAAPCPSPPHPAASHPPSPPAAPPAATPVATAREGQGGCVWWCAVWMTDALHHPHAVHLTLLALPFFHPPSSLISLFLSLPSSTC